MVIFFAPPLLFSLRCYFTCLFLASESFHTCVSDAFFAPSSLYMLLFGIGKLPNLHFRCFFCSASTLLASFWHRKASKLAFPMLFSLHFYFTCPFLASESFQTCVSDAFFALPLLYLPHFGIGKLPNLCFRCFFRSVSTLLAYFLHRKASKLAFPMPTHARGGRSLHQGQGFGRCSL